jgi:acyl carrier protein
MTEDPTHNPHDDPIPFDAFRRIIAQELQVEESKVVREASFLDDLFADSIQLVDLMLRMDEMGINIPLDAAWEVNTVGDAYRLYTEQTA